MQASELKAKPSTPYNRIGSSLDHDLPYAVTMKNLSGGAGSNPRGRTTLFPTHAAARRFCKAQPISFFDAINNEDRQ